jgi:hypothetical protein
MVWYGGRKREKHTPHMYVYVCTCRYACECMYVSMQVYAGVYVCMYACGGA